MALTQCCFPALCFPLRFARFKNDRPLKQLPGLAVSFFYVSSGKLAPQSCSVYPLAAVGGSTVTWDLALIFNRGELVIIAELQQNHSKVVQISNHKLSG